MAKKNYDDNSLKQLKGPDQVRLRPGVIFGSDGLDGCCHSVFEILSYSEHCHWYWAVNQTLPLSEQQATTAWSRRSLRSMTKMVP